MIIKELRFVYRHTHTHKTYGLVSMRRMQHHSTTLLPVVLITTYTLTPLTGYRNETSIKLNIFGELQSFLRLDI